MVISLGFNNIETSLLIEKTIAQNLRIYLNNAKTKLENESVANSSGYTNYRVLATTVKEYFQPTTAT